MMLLKKILFIVLLGFLSGQVYGQQDKKELDFVVVIDEKVWVTNTYFHIIANRATNADTIKANYHPGSLSISQLEYDKLISEEVKSIYLKFIYYEYVGSQQKVYNYEIEIKKPWLQDYFNILHIYNLDKKKYKKLYDPVEKSKNYTFELDSPSHTFKRVRKR